MYDACLWPVDAGCAGDQWNDLTESEQERALALATSSLIDLTGRRVGLCPVTVRPCKPASCPPGYPIYRTGVSWAPSLISGVWINSCGCPYNCGCTATCEIVLPGPVGEIYSIKVGGTEINTDFIRIDNSRILVWEGPGDCPFPATQNLSLPDTEPDTFSITYQNSYPVDSTASVAVTLLALEFAKACKPKGKCSLPRGVVSVVRSGVTFEIEAGLFPNGLTGLDVVDAFILKWVPAGSPKRAATVFSPGLNQPRRTRARSGGSGGSL